MKSRKIGAHHYNGKLNSRGSRQRSKIRAGFKKEDMTETFNEIDEEKKWLDEAHERGNDYY